MWSRSVGTLRETPGSSWVGGAPSSLSLRPEGHSFPPKIQDIVSKTYAHKDVPGFRRLGKIYTVRRRQPPANHKTKWDLRTASCFLHTRHRNPANKRATSTTNKRTTIFNISAWQRDRNRRFYKDNNETSGNFICFSHVYLQGYEQVRSPLPVSVLDVPAADCSLRPPRAVGGGAGALSAESLRDSLESLSPEKGTPPPFATTSLNGPPRGEGLRWNTPLGFRRRRSESLPGCWRGSPGCLPVWRPSLPGFDTSPFSCRGICRLSPRPPWWRRSPLRWRLQGKKCNLSSLRKTGEELELFKMQNRSKRIQILTVTPAMLLFLVICLFCPLHFSESVYLYHSRSLATPAAGWWLCFLRLPWFCFFLSKNVEGPTKHKINMKLYSVVFIINN